MGKVFVPAFTVELGGFHTYYVNETEDLYHKPTEVIQTKDLSAGDIIVTIEHLEEHLEDNLDKGGVLLFLLPCLLLYLRASISQAPRAIFLLYISIYLSIYP